MRIWSLHPKFLDAKGLVALWRESLLAKHVLEGKTIGYRNHPQLDRFKKASSGCINQYLASVYDEAVERGYNFDKEKIGRDFEPTLLTVTVGQLNYEKKHLLNKLKKRDRKKYDELQHNEILSHPLFKIEDGEIESWEISKK